MGLNRRDLLIMGGALGLSGAALAHGLLKSSWRSVSSATADDPAPDNLASTVSPASAPPSDAPVPDPPPPRSPAPSGMYAPQRGDVRLVVFSDINGRYRSTDYLRQVTEAIPLIPDWEPDLVICPGDMVAGQLLSLTRSEIEAMWNGFDQHIYQPIRQMGLPYAMTIGNHDASNHVQHGQYVFALERELANAYWNTPGRDPGLEYVDRAGFPFYYTFMHRDIFYLIWDASSANVPEEQVAWADRALASPLAQQAKMRIVMGHLPFYAVSQGRDRMGEILNRPDELRSLLERHHVHLYISGHHHAYYPGHVGSLQLLHCGALGSGPRSLLTTIKASIHTLTVVDLELETASIRYTTYDMTSKQMVNPDELPRLIVGPTGRVLRQDVEWNDLTPEEQNRPHVQST